jgi:8-oxo-dGTP pyrophosphatase MutT (NUDIX family)
MRKRRNLPTDWTAILFAESPEGIVCIRKHGKKYWELPGGKRHSNDKNSMMTLVREFREEVRIRLAISDVMLAGSVQEHNPYTHNPYRMDLFRARLTSEQLAGRASRSPEVEEIRIFSRTEFRALSNFSPYHRALLERFGVWKK